MEVLVICISLRLSGKKNKLRVYYLSWLRNRILHNDPEVEKKQGWITVGDLEGCVHYKVGKDPEKRRAMGDSTAWNGLMWGNLLQSGNSFLPLRDGLLPLFLLFSQTPEANVFQINTEREGELQQRPRGVETCAHLVKTIVSQVRERRLYSCKIANQQVIHVVLCPAF